MILLARKLAALSKNVIAIAYGVIQGLEMGESARCALFNSWPYRNRPLSEAMGAQKETLMGMCGVGDLVLTASSMQSRNFSLGVALGEGKTSKKF